jgi:cytochrome c553
MSCVLCHDPEATPDLDAPLCKLHSDEFVEQIQEMQAVAYELPKTTTNNCQDCVKILGKEV